MDELSAANCYCVDDLRIDARMRRVTRGDVDLGVTGLSFDLLLVLTRAAPGLVSVEVLMERVWRGVIVGPETVSQRVKLLRQALGESAGKPRYIVAVRNHGYRMAAIVAAPDATPAEEAPRSPRGMRRAAPWLLAMALGISLGAVWWGLGHRDSGRVAEATGNRPVPSVVPKFSVAVLPFANLTGDPAKEYFSDGMSAELINSLTQVRGLKVPARTSSFAYKGRNADIRGIAHDLDVAMILEGSVRSAGEHVRVTAELVDARSGYHIWSQSYDRQMADIFKLQDELATAIVAALQQHLGAAIVVPVIRTPPTEDVEAYRLFLQAMGTVRGTVLSLHMAMPLIDQALARDPNFAPALAARADFRSGLALLGAAPPSTIDDARADAEHALALNPGLAQAHSALAVIYFIRGDWVRAQMSYEAALAADRADARIHAAYSFILLASMGQLRQAQLQASEAYGLAPADPFVETILSGADSALGLDVEAGRLLKLATEIGRPRLGQELLVDANAAAHRGNFTVAAALAPEGLPPSLRGRGDEAVKLYYAALADPAKAAAARQSLKALIPQLRSETFDARIGGFFVVALVREGALDSAYELANALIDKAARLRVSTLGLNLPSLWLPEMRAFRQDLRFQGLVSRLMLIDYWRQFGPPDNCDLKDDKLSCR